MAYFRQKQMLLLNTKTKVSGQQGKEPSDSAKHFHLETHAAA